jgi:hypothetical protein
MTKFRPPTPLELAFLRVLTRGYPAAERQIETCLVSEWDDGYLEVNAKDGPPLRGAPNPVLGPAVPTGLEESPYLDSIFWTNDYGMISSIEVTVFGTATVSDFERMTIFVEADETNPSLLVFRNNSSPR